MGYGKDKVVVELIMPNPLTEDNYYAELELPANPSYISDALQRARCFRHGKEKLGMIVTHCERLPLLVNVEFDTPTIEEMDFFATAGKRCVWHKLV